ncbi:MAG TPA: hypothetical protein VGM18_05660 [Candidatus Sulfotelmatobacter sp.]
MIENEIVQKQPQLRLPHFSPFVEREAGIFQMRNRFVRIAPILACILAAATFATAQDVVGDFTKSPNEHIINEIDRPFMVSSVKGYLFFDDNKTPAPKVLFEIQGPGNSKKIRKATTDDSGRFSIRAPEGTYRFKTTLMSFQSEVGTVIVSKKYPKTNVITITTRPGV